MLSSNTVKEKTVRCHPNQNESHNLRFINYKQPPAKQPFSHSSARKKIPPNRDLVKILKTLVRSGRASQSLIAHECGLSRAKIHRFMTSAPRVNGWREIEMILSKWAATFDASMNNPKNNAQKHTGTDLTLKTEEAYDPLIEPLETGNDALYYCDCQLKEEDIWCTDIDSPNEGDDDGGTLSAPFYHGWIRFNAVDFEEEWVSDWSRFSIGCALKY